MRPHPGGRGNHRVGREVRFFLFVILGATDKRALSGFAPIAIGLALTLFHLFSIPVTTRR
jgi:glycerol uptake facilitator-like aquaporin